MKKERILITGGAGYIGSILTPLLLDQGYQVTVYDNLIYNQISVLNWLIYPNFRFVKSDVIDFEVLKQEIMKHDIIIPLAAIVGAPACSSKIELTKLINYESIKFIVKNSSSDQKILYPNSNSGYGIGKKDKYCDETSPLNPISLYARTKVQAEEVVLSSKNGIAFRLATVFGVSPRMRLDLLVNDFTFRACHDKFIILFEGHFNRNFVHVRDVAQAFIFGIENFDKMKGEIYNVGLNDANINKLQLCEQIKKHVPDLYIHLAEIGEDPDKRDYIVSSDKLEKLGWKPKYSLNDGIKELIAGYPFFKRTKFNNI